MKEALRPVGKDELVFDIEQALRKARKVWPRTRERSYGDVGPLHPAAVAVVEHLELCGIRCYPDFANSPCVSAIFVND